MEFMKINKKQNIFYFVFFKDLKMFVSGAYD